MHLNTIIAATTTALATTGLALPAPMHGGPYRAPCNTTEFKNTTTMTPGHSRHPPPKAVPVYHAPALCALYAEACAEACAAAMPFEGEYW
jgi:hypothetical protein